MMLRSSIVACVAVCLMAVTVRAHPSWGIVVAPDGSVYFADEYRNIIWKIDSRAQVTQFLTGLHSHGLTLDADGGVCGEDVQFRGGDRWQSILWRASPGGSLVTTLGPVPQHLGGGVLDQHGNRYEVGGNTRTALTIDRRERSGKTSVIAGGTPGRRRDGTGRQARLEYVNHMAWGPDNALYFTDGSAVRRMTTSGVVTTIADLGGVRGPDLPEPAAMRLGALAFDGRDVIIADLGMRRVVRLKPDRSIDVVVTAHAPWFPTGVAVRGRQVYVLEHGFTPSNQQWQGPRVRVVDTAGKARILATVNAPH